MQARWLDLPKGAKQGNANAEERVNDSLLQIWWGCVVLSCMVLIGAGQANPATQGYLVWTQ